MKISTKRGDGGESGLYNGRRESKAAPVFEVLGELDELQAFLGFCRFGEGVGDDLLEILGRLQDDVYRLMAVVGNEGQVPNQIAEVGENDLNYLEGLIEEYEAIVGDLRRFVRPGLSEAGARFHLARTVCRRAERALVRLKVVENQAVPKEVLQYVNRLSDLLFIVACKLGL